MLIVLLSLCSALFAQYNDYEKDEYVHVPFNIGLWPGVSTGDMWAEEAGYKKVYNTGIALSLIGMKAARLRGMDFSGLFSIYSEGVQGVQVSGIFNIVNGNVIGAQGTGIFTLVNGDIKGIQGSGIFSLQNGYFKGVRGNGIFNIQNGDFRGAQGNGIFNIQNGDFLGAQGTGVFNIQRGDFRGALGSGVFNIQKGDFEGLEAAGTFNIMDGEFHGVQLSTVNIVGGSFKGVQFGAVNVTRYFDKGLQIGIVNVTEENDGVPIGAFSYVRHVPIKYRVFGDDMRMVNFTIRSGNEKFYNDLLVSRRVEGDVRYHSLGVGFGHKQYLGDEWYFDYGVSLSKLLDDNFDDGKWRTGKLGAIGKLSFLFRYDLGYEASFFIGPVINAWVSELQNEDLSSSDLWVDEIKDDKYIRVWPGFVVGLEL